MWIVKDNIAMSCLPKNGSNSLHEVSPNKVVENIEVLNIPVRVAWIREPYKRLISAYSFFKSTIEGGGRLNKELSENVGSYEEFIDYTLNNNDEHWDSQVGQLTLNGDYLATVSHRFEDINELWSLYFGGFIPHSNGCVHKTVSDYRKDELDMKYKEDYELWLGL